MRELSFRGRREGDVVRGCVEMNVHRSGPDIVGKLLSCPPLQVLMEVYPQVCRQCAGPAGVWCFL